MPDYAPSYVHDTYVSSTNSPVLDRIVFTIDHIHRGGAGIYSTFEVVKYLVSHKIPVAIFMECTDPANFCRIDKAEASRIYALDPDLVTLGVHALPKGHSQEEQIKRSNLINNTIEEITGKKSVILSYHGAKAGPEPGIVFENIKYARGIRSWVLSQRFNRLDTPVMPMTLTRTAFKYINLRNKAGFTATLFVHTVELRTIFPQRNVFDTLVRQVIDKQLQALPYLSAMESDYSSERCPLRYFTHGQLSQNLYVGHVDHSGEIFQVAELQLFLNLLGYDAGMVDGTYGRRTSMAVLMFQVDNGLLADGQVGTATRESINTFCG